MTSGRDDAHRDTTCPISSIAKQRDRQAIVSGLLTLFGIGDLTPGSWAECGLNRDQLCMWGGDSYMADVCPKKLSAKKKFHNM